MLVSCVDTLKFVATEVELEAVLLPNMASRPGDDVGNEAPVPAAAVPNIAGGPSKNAGNPNDVTFVIEGVTLATVTKLSG